MTRGPLLRPEPAGRPFAERLTPPDWDAVFERGGGGLELELGCGAGGFALAYAARHPTIRYVAVEWRKKWAREVEFRARAQGLANLLVIEADARAAVPRLFTSGSLSGVHLQFPDPWWKRPHHKRTLLLPPFAARLHELCAAGAFFDFRSDVRARAAEALGVLEAAGFHNPLGPGAFHPPDPEDLPSSRERRYLAAGEPVFRARLVKPSPSRGNG